ncbi:MAG: TRAM domain-containing protein, partial [Xanthomonadales bacterium]|nr:TRAM domain-containing protein [Xanthomonadales bacterium]
MKEAEVDIVGMAHDGRGIARIDGKTVFVTGGLPGERARIVLRQRKRQFDEGEVLELLSRSPDRVEPRCQHFAMCGGCALQHLNPQAQIAAKQQVLADNLERIGKLQVERWLAPLTGEPWGYRRKG